MKKKSLIFIKRPVITKLLPTALAFSTGLFYPCSSFAQISAGGTPFGFSRSINENDISSVTMPSFDVEAMLSEDEINHPKKTGPYRFGNNFNVYLTPHNSGNWTTFPNGDRLWQLGIYSPGAYSINLTFTDYLLPEGAKLFVYNKEKDFVIGAFTNANNQEDRLFATDLVKGDHIIMEYLEPKSVANQGSLIVSMVTHAYRDLFNDDFSRSFGSSGSCNMNINCPDGTPWQNQKRSGIMLVSGGNGFCSASLVNNTQQDGTPYVLTANHCGSSGFGSWVFRFNWEASGCPDPGSSPAYQSITGSVSKASHTDSDFRLVQMNSTPPASYNVYYAGWNNVNAPPDSSVSIHHPNGDIKKIAFDDHPAVSASSLPPASIPNATWGVIWDRNTTTEPGSSGSPLFDQNHRIIGQLWGGGASCTNLTAPDYYGKFSMSWNTGTTASTRLRDWLDPLNSGATILDGYDPNAATFAFDMQPLQIDSIQSVICGTSAQPRVKIKNSGSTTLTSFVISYQLDGGSFTSQNWSGSLAPGATTNITLPAITFGSGAHTYTVVSGNPNSGTDENIANDTASFNFNVITNGQIATLTLTTDDYGSETTWKIKNSSNAIIYSGGPYVDVTGGQTFNYEFCLSEGSCYNFIINDADSNGICCAKGNGNYTLINGFGTTIASGAEFDTMQTTNFCISGTSINSYSLENMVSIYPNPSNGIVSAEIKLNTPENLSVNVYSMLGEKVIAISENHSRGGSYKIDLSQLSGGLYYIEISTGEEKMIKKLILKKE